MHASVEAHKHLGYALCASINARVWRRAQTFLYEDKKEHSNCS